MTERLKFDRRTFIFKMLLPTAAAVALGACAPFPDPTPTPAPGSIPLPAGESTPPPPQPTETAEQAKTNEIAVDASIERMRKLSETADQCYVALSADIKNKHGWQKEHSDKLHALVYPSLTESQKPDSDIRKELSVLIIHFLVAAKHNGNFDSRLLSSFGGSVDLYEAVDYLHKNFQIQPSGNVNTIYFRQICHLVQDVGRALGQGLLFNDEGAPQLSSDKDSLTVINDHLSAAVQNLKALPEARTTAQLQQFCRMAIPQDLSAQFPLKKGEDLTYKEVSALAKSDKPLDAATIRKMISFLANSGEVPNSLVFMGEGNNYLKFLREIADIFNTKIAPPTEILQNQRNWAFWFDSEHHVFKTWDMDEETLNTASGYLKRVLRYTSGPDFIASTNASPWETGISLRGLDKEHKQIGQQFEQSKANIDTKRYEDAVDKSALTDEQKRDAHSLVRFFGQLNNVSLPKQDSAVLSYVKLAANKMLGELVKQIQKEGKGFDLNSFMWLGLGNEIDKDYHDEIRDLIAATLFRDRVNKYPDFTLSAETEAYLALLDREVISNTIGEGLLATISLAAQNKLPKSVLGGWLALIMRESAGFQRSYTPSIKFKVAHNNDGSVDLLGISSDKRNFTVNSYPVTNYVSVQPSGGEHYVHLFPTVTWVPERNTSTIYFSTKPNKEGSVVLKIIVPKKVENFSGPEIVGARYGTRWSSIEDLQAFLSRREWGISQIATGEIIPREEGWLGRLSVENTHKILDNLRVGFYRVIGLNYNTPQAMLQFIDRVQHGFDGPSWQDPEIIEYPDGRWEVPSGHKLNLVHHDGWNANEDYIRNALKPEAEGIQIWLNSRFKNP